MQKYTITFLLLILVLYLGKCDISNVLPSYDFVTMQFISRVANLQKVSQNKTLKLGKRPLTFNEMAAKYGHPAEQYEVTTEDGYRLTVFRLRGWRTTIPVLLFHGMCDSSDTWIIRGYTSLAITLVNAGYDVWLGNNRGNRYARSHIYLSPEDPTFWQFSFNEIGKYDLAATIDLVLEKTGTKKLNAFGYSKGNTIFYVLLSTRPEYNAKLNVVTALAPICYLNNVKPPLRTLIKYSSVLYSLSKKIGVTNILGDDSPETTAFKLIAQTPATGYAIDVEGILFPLFGFDKDELEPEFLPTVGLHAPTWTSIQDLVHLGQVGERNEFAAFDYGLQDNQARYNSSKPPAYDLGKVVTKVVLLAAENDATSPLEDVATLKSKLPNVVKYVINPRKQMNHLDYIWGKNARNYLYKYIFEVLETYTYV